MGKQLSVLISVITWIFLIEFIILFILIHSLLYSILIGAIIILLLFINLAIKENGPIHLFLQNIGLSFLAGLTASFFRDIGSLDTRLIVNYSIGFFMSAILIFMGAVGRKDVKN